MSETVVQERYRPTEQFTQIVTTALPLSLEEALERCAEQQQLSKSAVIRRALKRYLDEELRDEGR